MYYNLRNKQIRILLNIDRVSMAQSSGISIFSSKEQEYEQKSQLLKRLAFVILCSENDQYHKHMPEIQGMYLNYLISRATFHWLFYFQND